MTSMADRAAERVRVLLDLDRHEDAAQAARDGLQSDPNNAELLGLLAVALVECGDVQEGRRWSERSLAVDPRQAWVHNTRARAILDGAGKPNEAVESARAATQLDHTDAYYLHTLTLAYIDAGRRKNAESTARSIRSIAPASPLGPLSQAMVEMAPVKYFDMAAISKKDVFWIALGTLFSRGLLLVIWAIVWLYIYVRRRGRLRRADAYMMEALRLDPGGSHLHEIAALVARCRFRFVRAVDSALAAAAIDGGLIDATGLARDIVRRTSVIAVVTFFFWCIFLLALLDALATPVVAGILGSASVVAAAAGVAWLYEEQTKRLPPGVQRLVQRRWGLPATVLVIAAWLTLLATSNPPGVAIPAGVGAALLLTGFGVLTAKLVSSRHIG
ncbi:tetratricopeptide repeat protein [Mycolicibacterium lutetiense]|uniref:Flp pilus assembly protein TadD n=1 Tax=Mycolicibacterium lutetiense TaxID=1641992 RepID=A0ABS4ZTA1_9MYCO|nr:tetratricopeptide repeat protein [Mycolicibacterium lutetiense]MBP2452714.1 Flp pilus assembly protein TadD [Mycolicibacterium lutetiense]